MATSHTIFRLALVAFFANAALCPCAAVTDDRVPVEQAAMHHGGSHDAHAAAESDHSGSHARETCHADTALEDCGMSAGIDIDLRAAKSERADFPAAVVDSSPASLGVARARAGPPVPQVRHEPPPGSPITRHDRLTI